MRHTQPLSSSQSNLSQRERLAMSKTAKPWIGTGISAVGLLLMLVWMPLGVAVSFVGFMFALVSSFELNIQITRLAVYAACGMNAVAVSTASESAVLALASLAGVLMAPVPLFSRISPRMYELTAATALAVGVLSLLFAGSIGLWRLAVAPNLMVFAFATFGFTANLKDSFRFDVSRTKLGVGSPMPDVELPYRNREGVFNLSEERGRPVLLCWLRGDWCPICQVMMRVYQREASKLAKHNIKLLAISPTSAEAADDDFLKDIGVDYDYLFDRSANTAEALGILHSTDFKGEHVPLPISLLIDSAGVLRYVSRPHDFSVLSDQTKVVKLLETGAVE